MGGKIAVMTGAARGFREEIAWLFAREGARLVVADLDGADLERLAGEIGAVARTQFGGLDIVVNKAGTTHRNGPMLEVDEAAFDRVYAVNVKSLYWVAQAAIPVRRDHTRVNSVCPVIGETGLIEEFMRLPNTAGESAEIHCGHRAGQHNHAGGCREYVPLAGRGCLFVHHRHPVARGRRSVCLSDTRIR